MLREGTLQDISDGRTYEKNDLVKADTNGCNGCFTCCTFAGKTIILDPFDVYKLTEATGNSFQELLNLKKIELNMVDGLILPNLYLDENSGCSFLSEEKRCEIHKSRPGICRLFPLGRIYDNDSFKYFVQKGQCVKNNLAKIKVKKWIDIDYLEENEAYIVKWHYFIKEIGEKMIRLRDSNRMEHLNDIAMYVLNEFYVRQIEADDDVSAYRIICERVDAARNNIGWIKNI